MMQQQQQVPAKGMALALLSALVVVATLLSPVQCGTVSSSANMTTNASLDSPALRIISDEDQTIMQHARHQIDADFSSFKSIHEVHAFLDKVGLLVQKHPKNVAFAQGDLRDLHKFLSQEIVTKLVRVDTDPFVMPISDDRMPLAQRAIDEDELTRKLFGGPLKSLIEAKREQAARLENSGAAAAAAAAGGNHKGGNFFSNFWCKISGNC